jgi:hypothetical protein
MNTIDQRIVAGRLFGRVRDLWHVLVGTGNGSPGGFRWRVADGRVDHQGRGKVTTVAMRTGTTEVYKRFEVLIAAPTRLHGTTGLPGSAGHQSIHSTQNKYLLDTSYHVVRLTVYSFDL